MSGPKSSSYRVESAAEIEARAAAAATARLARAVGAARAAQAEAEKLTRAFGVRVHAIRIDGAAGTHSSSINAEAIRLEEEAARLRAEVTSEREAARRAVVDAIADRGGVAEHHAERDGSIRAEVDRLNRQGERRAADEARAQRRSAASHLVAQVYAEVEIDALEEIVRLAEAFVDDDGPTATAAVARLQDAVSRENGRAIARAHAAAACADLLPLLDGVELAAAHALRNELEAAVAAGAPIRAGARAEAEAIAEQWTATADATFAAAVIADGLQELGYLVEEGFETLVVSGDGALVVSDDEAHGVRVFRADNDRLVFAPLALSPDATAERQTAFETEFCGHYAEVARRAGSHGVQLGLETDVTAGSGVEARLVADESARARRRRIQQRPRERQRRL